MHPQSRPQPATPLPCLCVSCVAAACLPLCHATHTSFAGVLAANAAWARPLQYPKNKLEVQERKESGKGGCSKGLEGVRELRCVLDVSDKPRMAKHIKFMASHMSDAQGLSVCLHRSLLLPWLRLIVTRVSGKAQLLSDLLWLQLPMLAGTPCAPALPLLLCCRHAGRPAEPDLRWRAGRRQLQHGAALLHLVLHLCFGLQIFVKARKTMALRVNSWDKIHTVLAQLQHRGGECRGMPCPRHRLPCGSLLHTVDPWLLHCRLLPRPARPDIWWQAAEP
jgi:hypothetical protein